MTAPSTDLPTGVPGLDAILGGGLLPGSVVLLAGPPGSGKTVLSQQMCFANATPDRKAIFYTTLSESHAKLGQHLRQFRFFDQHALGSRVEYVHLGDLLRQAPERGLTPVVSEVVRVALDEQPGLIVIDSVKMLRDFVGPSALRTALYDLTSRIGHTDTVVLMVGEYTCEEILDGMESSLADGIIQLAYEPRVPVDRRWLRVVKMRGRDHLTAKHTLQITLAGVQVFPRTETQHPQVHLPVSGRLPTGVSGLDELMGGGIPAADATLVVGPSGIGKSTLSLAFIAEGLDRGEHGLYVSFQETPAEIVRRAGDLGTDLDTYHRQGALHLHHMPMRGLDLDALAAHVRTVLQANTIRRVVIESLEHLVYAAREADRFPAYKRTLVDVIRAAGAALLETSESTVVGVSARPWEGLTFLFDNVIQLRYIEFGSDIGRAVSITKMRHSGHDMGLHELHINHHGCTIGRKLDHVTGVLGWTQLRQQPDQL
jgi:circadian clock protein KaiC